MECYKECCKVRDLSTLDQLNRIHQPVLELVHESAVTCYIMMRNVLSILAIVLSVSGPFSTDLQRLPALVQHYHHHVTAHGEASLSFMDFVADHLGDHDQHDSEHQNLPFHSLQSGTIAPGLVAVPASIEPRVFENAPAVAIHRVHDPVEPPTGSIFQPPRV